MNDTESFFGDPDPIFVDKELLRVSHLPEGDRIIGREEELGNLANAIKDAQRGGTPNNVLIYGKTGTGKSLCSKYITQDLTEAAAENGVHVDVAYIDCFQDSTETQAVRTVAESFNDRDETGCDGSGVGCLHVRLLPASLKDSRRSPRRWHHHSGRDR